jgi:hypothetical protein
LDWWRKYGNRKIFYSRMQALKLQDLVLEDMQLPQEIKMKQKNMMVLLGVLVELWLQQEELLQVEELKQQAFGAGGFTTTIVSSTEEYDGTSWGPGGNLNTARWLFAGCGTQTAGLGFGGYNGTANSSATEEYDGSSLDSRWKFKYS